MRTKLDPDDDLYIAELTDEDWSRARPSPYRRKPGEKTEIFIDGAVGYSLRLIPSNKVLARFTSTLEAWPVIIATVEGGRSPRTLSLDMMDVDGQTQSISAGPRLERFARHCNGESHPYADRGAPPARGVETPASPDKPK